MSATAPQGRRVAVVLAASRGLGFATAAALADSGHDLVVCGRDDDRIATAAVELRECGGEVETVVADVAEAADVARVIERAAERYGRLDVLVANAGGPPPGDFMDLDDDAWAAGFELTLMSAIRAMRSAVPHMREAGFGRLVVIGSSSVRKPLAGLVLSNAYRPALDGVIKSLAVELAPDGITANMVSPGRIDTERVRDLDARQAAGSSRSPDEVRSAAEATIPAGRYGRPEELAAVVAFLASEAAGYVTGQSVLADGGLVPTLP